MSAMPRPRPPHLHREETRHGKVKWFVRVGHGPRTRILSEYGTDEFKRAYDAAIAGTPIPSKGKPSSRSLRWLIDRYKETTAWSDLSYATRRQRDNFFKQVIAKSGGEPYKAIKKSDIVAARDRRAHTPNQARNFLDAMRGLFRWAVEAGHLATDPTIGVKNPKRKKGAGFPPWTEEDVEKYETRWPLGTKERVWLAVLLYSGLRRSDAHRYGRQHVKNGVGTIQTKKSGETITVTLPILPVFQEALDAGPTGDFAFCVGVRGLPLAKETFGNDFSAAARKAGVFKSAHGVRKIAATRCADNGATEHELDALFGWTGGRQAAVYTKEANRKRLALGAIGKMQNASATSIPAPGEEVRDSERKAK